MVTLAIGDVHGNVAALRDLLAAASAEVGRGDTVVFLADYIDRGPDSRPCLDTILDFRSTALAQVVCLKGNHEDWLLRTLSDFRHHSWLLGMDGLGTAGSYSSDAEGTLRDARRHAGLRLYTERLPLPYEAFFSAVPRPHLEFLSSLQVSIATRECFCSHAGLNPRLRIEEQPPDAFIWGDAAFPDTYKGEVVVVYGHWNDAIVDERRWPQPNVRINTIGIDTIDHGVLTAIRLPGRCVFQSARHSS